MIWRLLVLLLVSSLVHCAKNVSGTSEVGNPQRIAGVVIDTSGRAAEGVHVTAVPINFNPLENTLPNAFASSYSGADGQFILNIPESFGLFNLLAQNSTNDFSFFKDSLSLNDIDNFDTLVLRRSKGVTFYLHSDQNCFLVFKGTPFYSELNNDSITFLLPSYEITPSAVAADGSSIPINPISVPIPIITAPYLSQVKFEDMCFQVLDTNSVFEYQFDWGDDSISEWSSGTDFHSWSQAGVYEVKARTRPKQQTTYISAWSNPLKVTIIDKHIVTVPDKPYYPGICNMFTDGCTFITGGSESNLGDPVEYSWIFNADTSKLWYQDSALQYLNNGVILFFVRAQARSTRDTLVISEASDTVLVPLK